MSCGLLMFSFMALSLHFFHKNLTSFLYNGDDKPFYLCLTLAIDRELSKSQEYHHETQNPRRG